MKYTSPSDTPPARNPRDPTRRQHALLKARRKSNADGSARAMLGEEMLGVCQNSLVRFGATRKRSLGIQPIVRATFARRLLADFGKTARVHSFWQREPAYLDDLGHPKIIPIQGPSPSFQALCALAGLADEWKQLLALGTQFGLSKRGNANRLIYVSDVMLLTGHPTLVLARAAVTIERYLQTCLHNAQPGRRQTDSRGDVTAEVSLSEGEFGRLRKETRRFLGNFIESTDRQLLAAVARDARKGRTGYSKRWCGVTAFVFRD